MQQRSQATHYNNRSVIMFFIILFAIIVDEAIDTILIEAIVPLNETYSWLTNSFIILSMPFALLLAGWSDFHSRRKTLIFALASILASILLILCYNLTGNNSLAISSLIVKAIGGNAIPIALASLADIMPANRFRSSLAIAICAYSAGSWVPIYFRENLSNLIMLSSLTSLVCFTIVYFFFKDYEFDNILLNEKKASIRDFFPFLKKEIFQIGMFIAIPLVACCLGGFMISETSFYQILLRGEVLPKDIFLPFASITMASGYYAGTLLLFFLGQKKISDIQCLKYGIVTSIVSIFLFTLTSFFAFSNKILPIFFLSLFALGFGLFIPSLFSQLSRKRHENEQGKIYGLLESTDSIAILASIAYIKYFNLKNISLILSTSLILFIISYIITLKFIKMSKSTDHGKDA